MFSRKNQHDQGWCKLSVCDIAQNIVSHALWSAVAHVKLSFVLSNYEHIMKWNKIIWNIQFMQTLDSYTPVNRVIGKIW